MTLQVPWPPNIKACEPTPPQLNRPNDPKSEGQPALPIKNRYPVPPFRSLSLTRYFSRLLLFPKNTFAKDSGRRWPRAASQLDTLLACLESSSVSGR